MGQSSTESSGSSMEDRKREIRERLAKMKARKSKRSKRNAKQFVWATDTAVLMPDWSRTHKNPTVNWWFEQTSKSRRNERIEKSIATLMQHWFAQSSTNENPCVAASMSTCSINESTTMAWNHETAKHDTIFVATIPIKAIKVE
jgi:hypothetical protein